MPELPEVETVARTLAPYVQDCVFEDSTLLRSSTLHPLSLPLKSLAGQRISALRRRAKLLVFDLVPLQGNEPIKPIPSCLVIHLRMTGRIFTAKANAESGQHTRCIWNLRKPDQSSFQLFFDDTRTFGKVFVANKELLSAWKFWRELGPEPLELNLGAFLARLRGKRALKASLLDQKVLAGIGNIYADEALFRSGINPQRPTDSLEEKEAEALLKAIKDVLNMAILKKGSSIRDYRDADGKAGNFQKSFFVYGRGGEKCRKCGTILEKIRIGGRSTVFCPQCQH